MARKRMIDPSIWADEDFAMLSSEAKIMFIGMISNADDEGRMPGNALFLSSTILPYQAMTKDQAIKIRDEIIGQMKSVTLYEVNGKEYICFLKWKNYQKVDHPSESNYPSLSEGSKKNPVSFTESSPNLQESIPPNRINRKELKEENRKEELLREEKQFFQKLDYLKDIPPDDLEEFTQKFSVSRKQVIEKGSSVFDSLISRGLKTKYKDYKALMRNILRRDFGERKVILPNSFSQANTLTLGHLPDQTPEEKAKADAKLQEIRSRFHPNQHAMKGGEQT